MPFSSMDGSRSLWALRTTCAASSNTLVTSRMFAEVTSFMCMLKLEWCMAGMSICRHSLTRPLCPTPMSIVADTRDRTTTNGAELDFTPPSRSDEYVLFRISPQDVQCVSSIHATPRAQTTARTASVLLWHAVHARPFTSSLRRLHRMKMVDSWSSTASSSQCSSLSAYPNFVFVAEVGRSAVTWAVSSAAGRTGNCKKTKF